MTSIHQSAELDKLDELEENCKAFKDAELDLMVFYLPPPHSADVLKPLAALAERVG
jgi:hypothetical protein